MFNSKFNKQFSTKLQELNDLIHQYDQSNTTNVNVIMELINNLAEQVSVIPTLTQQLTDLNASMVELAKREQKSNIPDMMKYSKEPWMQFVSGKIDPDKGVELSIDWNTAFIEQLKQNGYTGISELQIVSKYIASVANKCQQSVHGDE